MKHIEENTQRLQEEADAFDRQIRERVEAGHIPDLRRVEECQYFYNNSWRHPDYVKLDFGDQFEIIHKYIKKHTLKRELPIRVLEVGCGPGYITLELSRNKLDVTGIDLSSTCIEVAKRFADDDPWKDERVNLDYLVCDFLKDKKLGNTDFDVIVFNNSLHHFPDQTAVMERCKQLLSENGLIIVNEPTRDTVTKGNAAFMHLIKLLLSVGGGYYEQFKIPENKDEQLDIISDIYDEMRYEGEKGEKLQSVNDNEAGYTEMLTALNSNFLQLKEVCRYGFFHEVIGGLRFDQETNGKLARYLRDADRELCRLGALQPTEFFYVGKLN